ncbi:chemotaxis protein CheW [Natrononativus amylolyticus]|uniref:chemotaxis protein CheW n=1 Tax=Natrononativus amylolyticus TaxID=2963434 RepID=UPI0020CBCD09|nr:chemotaxis protein CheW [Natrononativus amylolyticus]
MTPDLPESLLKPSSDESGAPPAGAPDETEELVRFVVLEIGPHRLAVDVDDVKTITDPPETLTAVPRSSRAVDGVTDLRGEITAVIDSRVHFPVEAEPPAAQRLIVFDRPTDRQPAAIRVDEVVGVETVPERAVRGADDLEDPTVAGGAIDHPLVCAIVEQERTPARSARGTRPHSPTAAKSADSTARERVASRLEQMGRGDSRDGDEFSTLEADEPATESEIPASEPVVVEATPLIDVDRLLRASGAVD